jgi:hypothetical protein
MMKAALLLVLLPFLGSKIVLSSVFVTRDHHLVYQTFKPNEVCADIYKIRQTGRIRGEGPGKVYVRFEQEFSKQEGKTLLKRWNNIACRSSYTLELGNIGSETISLSELDFQTHQFQRGEKSPPVLLEILVQDISAASPRESDPEYQQQKGKLRISNLAPGTMMTIRFGGWINGKGTSPEWPRMMTRLDIGEGEVEIGSPSATAFAKFLTIFF